MVKNDLCTTGTNVALSGPRISLGTNQTANQRRGLASQLYTPASR